jgi:hypothetical protein
MWGGSAGDEAGGGELRSSSSSPFCCGMKSNDASGACTREGEERKDWREEMTASHCVGINDKWQLYCSASACNLRSLAASLARGKEGKWRGEVGIL